MLLTKSKQLLGTHIQDGYVVIGGQSYHTLLTTRLYGWIDANDDDLIRWQVTKQLSGGVVTRLDWYNSVNYKLTITGVRTTTPYNVTNKSVTSVANSETNVATGSFTAEYDSGGIFDAQFKWQDNWYPFDENALITVNNVTMPPKMTGSFTIDNIAETSFRISYEFPVSIYKLWVLTSDTTTAREYVQSGSTGTVTVSSLPAGENIGVQVRGILSDNTYISCPSQSVQLVKYPYCTDARPFRVQDTIAFSIANPLHRSCTVKLMSGMTQLSSVTITGTSASFNTGTFRSQLYSLLGTANSAPYFVRVTYSGHNSDTDASYFTLEEGYFPVNLSVTGTRGTISSPDPVGQSVQLQVSYERSTVANNSMHSPLTVAIRASGTTSTNTYTFTQTSATGTFLIDLTDTIELGKEYQITVSIYDTIGYQRGLASTAVITIPKSVIPFSIYDNGIGDVGIAVGQMATRKGLGFAKGQEVWAVDQNNNILIMDAVDLFEGGGPIRHTSGNWIWYEYSDGRKQAYYHYTAGTTTATLWGNQTYYKDFTIGNFPSGLSFTAKPKAFATCNNNQWWVAGVNGHSTTSGGTVRLGKPTSGGQAVDIEIMYEGY